MRGEGFLNFYIAALITGSILGMDRKLLIKASIQYLPAIIGGVIVTVVGAVIGAGMVGRFCGFHPIESAITAGLCMADMGGIGDVAVLSASKRMKLMPFAQISSRLGGALMLILATALLQIFSF